MNVLRLSLAVIALSIAFAQTTNARGDSLPKEVLLMPDIGEYLWLVEEYMATAWYGQYFETGALTSRDIYAGFGDVDGDGLDNLVFLVDHKTACTDQSCDVFVFTADVQNPTVNSPCNWLFASTSQSDVKRSLYERFVVVNGQTITLKGWPSALAAKIEGEDWGDYFERLYDTSFESDEILLSHVRIGTYDLNGDGQDEVFIYVVSPPICGRDECGGATLELSPSEDGSKPAWRWIGELNSLDPAMHIVLENEAYVWPGRTMRVIDETVDGYASLCSRSSYLRWNGETYDIRFYVPDYEAEQLGCPD